MGGSAHRYVLQSALAQRSSDDEDPFGHGGALEAEDESGASTHRRRNEFESPEEHHVISLVLGSGVVHHSHAPWLLRGIVFCWKGAPHGARQRRDC